MKLNRKWMFLVSVLFLVGAFGVPTPHAVGTPAQAIWKAGDKVEAWNVAWYKATILEVGSGEHDGFFKVHYDEYSSASDQWVKASRVRSRAVPAAAKKANEAGEAGVPRPGKYLIYSHGAAGNVPLFLGHFELQSGGRYRASRGSSGDYYGSGKYAYDAKTKSIRWLSGPYKKDGWSGAFTVSREGKTHNIRLRPTTNASNSTDSKY